MIKQLLCRIFCSSKIVGAWYVDAIGAPYVPHQFTFHADGTLLTTNPTNVQENPNSPHGGTNDSVGMGAWRIVTERRRRYVIGTFKQLNAFAEGHAPTDTLSVSFRLVLHGDEFDGPAIAKLGDLSAPATLHGSRIVIDEAAIEEL